MITFNWTVHIAQKHWAPELEKDYAERIVNGTEKMYYFILWSEMHPACDLNAIVYWLCSILSLPLFETTIGTPPQRCKWWRVTWKSSKEQVPHLAPTERGPGVELKGSLNLKKLHYIIYLHNHWTKIGSFIQIEM